MYGCLRRFLLLRVFVWAYIGWFLAYHVARGERVGSCVWCLCVYMHTWWSLVGCLLCQKLVLWLQLNFRTMSPFAASGTSSCDVIIILSHFRIVLEEELLVQYAPKGRSIVVGFVEVHSGVIWKDSSINLWQTWCFPHNLQLLHNRIINIKNNNNKTDKNGPTLIWLILKWCYQNVLSNNRNLPGYCL